MNPLRKLAFWAGSKAVGVGGGVAVSLTNEYVNKLVDSQPATTRHVINDESAMRITTAFACVRVIAETIGAVTMGVFERQKKGNAVRVDHDLAGVLIDKPNVEMSGLEYREAKGTNLAARGNAYSLIERRGDGQVLALYPIPAAHVTPKRSPDTNWKLVYEVNERGKAVPYPPEKIWHWKGFGYNGFEGLSPIGCAREALGLALGGEEAQARLFANGMATTALIKIPQWLKPDQRVIANQKLAELHSGLVNYGRPYLLEGGMDVADGVFAPKDAQFLELRRFQISELCRLWRISPHMIADLERATNNNIEQLSLEFVMYTMLPYFRRIEEKAQQLFTVEDRSRFFVRFNFESLLRADSTARAQLYSILLQNGVYSRNEVRALENRNQVDDEGMDDFTVQSNMTLMQMLEDMVRAQAARQSNTGGNQP